MKSHKDSSARRAATSGSGASSVRACSAYARTVSRARLSAGDSRSSPSASLCNRSSVTGPAPSSSLSPPRGGAGRRGRRGGGGGRGRSPPPGGGPGRLARRQRLGGDAQSVGGGREGEPPRPAVPGERLDLVDRQAAVHR